MSEKPFVSVVIPAYNEELNIAKTLESISKQDYTGKIEVVVCDNNSTDRTAGIAEENGARVVKETQKGTRFAYDRAMKESKGEIIIATNADTLVPTNWISRIVETYEDKEVVGVGTRVKFYNAPKWVNTYLNISNNKLNIKPAMWGTSLSCRRSVYDKVGGFNHGVNTNEDAVFTLLIEKFGKVKILSDVVVEMDGRRFNKGTFSAAREWFKGYGLNSLYMQLNYVVTGEIKTLVSDFQDYRSQSFGKGEEAQIAVIIPTGNHQKQIANVLTTLEEQDVQFSYKVYILDNFCVDQSLNIAKLFKNVTVIKYPYIYNYGEKLSKLVSEVKEPVIAFTTPEADLPTDWLTRIYKYFDQNKDCILSGPYINYNSDIVTKVTKQPLENLTNKFELNNLAVSTLKAKEIFQFRGDKSEVVEQIRKKTNDNKVEIDYEPNFKSYFDGPGAFTASANVIKNTFRKLGSF